MGNPAIYYYPDGTGSLEVVDLGEGLSNIEELPGVLVEDAVALDGTPYRMVLGPAHRVRIELERFGAPGANSLERKLQALASHLRRGGMCGVTRDTARTFAGSAAAGWKRGNSTIATYGNEFTAWSAAGAVGSGDEVAVEAAPPGGLYEVRLVSALVSAHTVNFSGETLAYSYDTSSSSWLRWRDFWPVCYLPSGEVGKMLITHDRRRNYSLDLPLVYLPSLMAAMLASVAYDAVPLALGAASSAGSGLRGGGDSAVRRLRGIPGPATDADLGATLESLAGSRARVPGVLDRWSRR